MVSFGRRVSSLAEEHPGDVAFVVAALNGDERSVTWAELDRRSNQVARLLVERAAGQGQIVVDALPNSPEHLIVAVAAWKAGACVLPLRWDLPLWERQRLLEVAAPAAVVAAWDDDAADAIGPTDLDTTEHYDAGALPDALPRPAIAIASAGSTGAPKLIVSPESGAYDPAPLRYQTALQDAGTTVHLVPGPLYHTNGFRISQAALMNDELFILLERFDAALAADVIERHRVTSVVVVPTMLHRIARLPDIDRRDLSSVRQVVQGGAPCPPWLVARWIELVGAERFYVTYGSSERVGLTMIRGDEWLKRPGSVGRGVATDIRVVDEERRPVPSNEVGEIYMRTTERGAPSYEYRGAPAARTTDDGFTSIGDLGWLDEDGYLYIADRRSDLIISGGANVYPAEVEAALLEHPAVADAAVVGLPDDEWGRRVHAVVEAADPATPPTVEQLAAHCAQRLAAYKRPKSFDVVDRLPRSEAGKLNRTALAEQLAATAAGREPR